MDRDTFTWQRTEIRNVTLDSKDLKKIHRTIRARVDVILMRDKEIWERNNPDVTEEKRLEAFNEGKKTYQPTTIIKYKSGDHISFENEEIFEDINDWNIVEQITIDGGFLFRVKNKNDMNPTVKLEISLTDSAIMNPTLPLSSGTLNESSLHVSGGDRDWCTRTHADIINIMQQKKNLRNLIHAKFFYDFLMWVVYIPFLVYIMWKNNENLMNWERSNSLILTYFIGFGCLMLCLLIFRFVFEYFRWLFPTVELKDAHQEKTWHRYFLAFIPIGPIGLAVWKLL